jgi:hypothetical protein
VPVWHASIAVQSDFGLVPYARWGLKTRTIVKRTVIGLLDGVGTGDAKRCRSEYVLHARRRLSEPELAAQTP